MDHNQAVENQAVERYFLRAMSTEERDEFEEHYFSCAICGDEVRAASRFRAGAREILSLSDPAPHTAPRPLGSPRHSWWQWPTLVPTFAALALLGVVIYQASNTLGPVQSMAVVALHATTRGESDVARIPAGGRFFTVYFDVPAAPAAALYQCTVTDSSGKVVAVADVPAPKSAEPLNLLFNRSDFPPGQYTITVQGDKRPVLPQLKFIVE